MKHTYILHLVLIAVFLLGGSHCNAEALNIPLKSATYKISFASNCYITFKGVKAGDPKQRVMLKVPGSQVPEILLEAADLAEDTLHFYSSNGKFTALNSKGKRIPIAEKMWLTIGDVAITIEDAGFQLAKVPTGITAPATATTTEAPGAPYNDCGYLFIPCPAMEADWLRGSGCCNALTAPKLNKHTKWALTYDFNQQDPVATWIRKNKNVSKAGTSCCGAKTINTNLDLGKNYQGLNKLKYALELFDKTYSQAQNNGNEYLAGLKQQKEKERNQLLESSTSKELNDKDYERAADLIHALTKKILIYQVLNEQRPVLTGAQPFLPIEQVDGKHGSGCCSQVYCGVQKAYPSPSVDRNFLITVANAHPFRDSVALSVSYDDEFMTDAALFTSTFAAATGTTTAAAPTKQAPTNDGDVPETQGGDEAQASAFIQTLDSELNYYYQSKFADPNLQVAVLANGVIYIKARINAVLNITASEAAIIAKAEELASQKADADKAKLIIDAGKRAGMMFTKIISYKTFDSKSILVQNKDIMNLKLLRYHDGKLMTSPNEATRSYHTRWGFKADFSVGLMGSTLKDHEFTSLTVLKQDTFYHVDSIGVIDRTRIDSLSSPAKRDSIIRKDNGNFNIGAAVLAHFYWRTGGYANLALTLGFAINQDADTRYLVGGSLMIMRTSRLVITGGAILGKVKRLADGYHEGQIVNLAAATTTTIPTTDRFCVGGFVGLSWNIAGFSIGGKK